MPLNSRSNEKFYRNSRVDIVSSVRCIKVLILLPSTSVLEWRSKFLQADCRSALPLPSHLLTIRPPDGDGREALGSSFYVVRGVLALRGDAVRSTYATAGGERRCDTQGCVAL